MKLKPKFDVGDYVWMKCLEPNPDSAVCCQIFRITWEERIGMFEYRMADYTSYFSAREYELYTTKKEALASPL